MKKVLVSVLAVVLLVGSTFSVNAAGLRDVFSAKYYADKYPDLKAAFGYDEEMLWQHYQDYGLKEGRNMSPILDVKEYREKYADLNAAFGDNWDAYVQHFFDYGINENRDNGTNFDVKTYIEAYEDIAEAFGDDLVAAAEHYLNFGMEENRTKGDPEVYQAEIEAEKEAASAPSQPGTGGNGGNSGNGGSDSGDRLQPEYNENGELIYEPIYDEAGRLVRANFPMADSYMILLYDENGVHVRSDWYNLSDDVMTSYDLITYEGDLKYERSYTASGRLTREDIFIEDCLHSSKSIYLDGSISLIEYDGDGFESRETFFNAAGEEEYIIVYYPDGSKVIYLYNEDGSYEEYRYEDDVEVFSRVVDANGQEISSSTTTAMEDGTYERVYKEMGVVDRIAILNSDMQPISEQRYDDAGNVAVTTFYTYDENNNLVQEKMEWADGTTRIWTYDENRITEIKTVRPNGEYYIDTYDENGIEQTKYVYTDGSYVITKYNGSVDDVISEEWFNADGTPKDGPNGGGNEGGNGDTGNDDEEDTGYGEFDEEPGIGKLDYDYEEITNDEGVVIRANWSYNGIIYYYDIYEYDEEGRVSVVTTYWAGEDCVRTESFYTYEGETVKETQNYYRDDDESLMWTATYIDDRVMTRLSYLPSGQKWFEEFTYEESGLHSTFTTIYAVDDTILSYRKEEWVMDGENGMRYKITEYDADRNIVSEKFRGE